MRGSRVLALAAAGLLTVALVGFGAFATYAMVGHPGMWNMEEMHQRMMGGGADTSGAQLTQGATQQAVQIRDFTFTPGNLQVPVGATITWTNYDSAPHSATADDGTWGTSILNMDQQASITFNTPGEYSYYCTVHPSMKARIQVQ